MFELNNKKKRIEYFLNAKKDSKKEKTNAVNNILDNSPKEKTKMDSSLHEEEFY